MHSQGRNHTDDFKLTHYPKGGFVPSKIHFREGYGALGCGAHDSEICGRLMSALHTHYLARIRRHRQAEKFIPPAC